MNVFFFFFLAVDEIVWNRMKKEEKERDTEKAHEILTIKPLYISNIVKHTRLWCVKQISASKNSNGIFVS